MTPFSKVRSSLNEKQTWISGCRLGLLFGQPYLVTFDRALRHLCSCSHGSCTVCRPSLGDSGSCFSLQLLSLLEILILRLSAHLAGPCGLPDMTERHDSGF